MQFICSADPTHKFHYPAKLTNIIDGGKSLGTMYIQADTKESHVCPFCLSLKFTEYIEPEPEITSVKSVPLEDVDAWLKEGYIVRELYAKTATLIKREAPAQKDLAQIFKEGIEAAKQVADKSFLNPDPDDNQAIIEANQTDYGSYGGT